MPSASASEVTRFASSSGECPSLAELDFFNEHSEGFAPDQFQRADRADRVDFALPAGWLALLVQYRRRFQTLLGNVPKRF
jgi:hypothetical protein